MSLALLALTLVVRLIPAWLLMTEAADVEGYHDLGWSVLQGDNVYAHRVFPWSPYSQFLLAWAVRVADASGWRFDFVVKLPSILADAGTSLLLFSFLSRRGATLSKALLWSLAWALNPVAILGSAFHGNMMEILPVLILAAYYGFETESRDRDLILPLSALLFGLAIALRPYPILLLPVFLILGRARERLLFTLLALFPASLSSLPYLVHARHIFLRETLGYQGLTDFGWGAVIRALSYVLHGRKIFSFDVQVVSMSQRLFLGAYALFLLTVPFFKTSSLGRALLIPPLLFFALYMNVSAQYLIWVLPVALVLRERLSLLYTVVAAAAMVFFYSIYQSEVLNGRFPPLLPDNRTVALAYTLANVVFVVLCGAWTYRILKEELGSWLRRPAPTSLAARFGPKLRRAYVSLILLGSGCWIVYLVRTLERARKVALVLLS